MTQDDQHTNGTNGEDPAPAEQAGAPSVPGTPEERIAALEAEKQELRDRMLRIAAEFDNWKKRSRREQTDLETKARESVLRDLLEMIDNLERATASWQTGPVDAQAIKQGVQLVLRQGQSKLDRHDVKAIEAKGKPFDPREHDAISQVPSADVAPGTVLSELQKGYRIGDRLLRPASVVVAIAGASVANFWLALMTMDLFAVQLRWLPLLGAGSWQHYVLPALALGLLPAALIARMTRSSMLEVIRQDYIRTARAKGLGAWAIYRKHALRNALIPIVTIVGLNFGGLLGGAVVTESVFNWPGIGRLLVDAVRYRDYPIIQGVTLLTVTSVVVVNFLADLVIAAINPRIRFD